MKNRDFGPISLISKTVQDTVCCCCYVEFIVAAHVDDDERLSLAQCLISFYTANRAARLYTVIYSYIQAFIGRT